MQYASIVDVWQRVSATSKRTEKVEHLASVLRTAPGELVSVVVSMLVGEPRQGRLVEAISGPSTHDV